MKKPKWRLGCYTSEEQFGLRFLAIFDTGSVAEWNEFAKSHHPDRIILPGDLLVEIEKDPRPDKDGVRGSGKELRAELYTEPTTMRCTIRAGSGHATHV